MMWKTGELQKIGIHESGVISTAEIVFDQEIRKLCEQNVCRLYGTSWACPPAVGTVEECRARCLRYASAMVFNAVYPLEDSFDYEGMQRGHGAFKELCDRLYTLAKAGVPLLFLIPMKGAGGVNVVHIPRRNAESRSDCSLLWRGSESMWPNWRRVQR